MQSIYILIPLVILAIGFILGVARLYKALIFLVCWATLGCVIIYSGLYLSVKNDNIIFLFGGCITAFLMMVPSVWLATLFSFVSSKPINPAPIVHVCKAYKTLNKEQKEKLHAVARQGARMGAKYIAQQLTRKGRTGMAGIVTEIADNL